MHAERAFILRGNPKVKYLNDVGDNTRKQSYEPVQLVPPRSGSLCVQDPPEGARGISDKSGAPPLAFVFDIVSGGTGRGVSGTPGLRVWGLVVL